MIKLIIFDYGGVIAGHNSEESGLFGLCQEFSKLLNLPARKIYSAYHSHWRDWKLGKTDMETVYTDFVSELGMTYDIDKLIEVTLDYPRLNKQVFELVKKLKKDYKIVCLTNHAREWFEYDVKRFKLNSVFDKIFTSYELGIAKPDLAIYSRVLAFMKVKPEEAVFIDDLESNVRAATKLKINTIHFESYAQLKEELSKFHIKDL